jgi:uncharacterized surface protein with fasciclin (FAS1) repeats
MIRRLPTLVSAAALTLAVAGLAACGEKAESTDTATATTETTTTTTAEAPAAGGAATDASATGEQTVTVGGAPMYPSKNIIDNAVNSADHKTLVAAVTAAGLVDTLKGTGPFTVFAPTDAAFGKLPAGTVESLTQPAQKGRADQDPDLPRRPGPPHGADLTDGQKS